MHSNRKTFAQREIPNIKIIRVATDDLAATDNPETETHYVNADPVKELGLLKPADIAKDIEVNGHSPGCYLAIASVGMHDLIYLAANGAQMQEAA